MKKGELIVVNKKEISIKNMGYILKQARLKMGYTRDQLSERVGISHRYLTAIENEERRPSYEVLSQAAPQSRFICRQHLLSGKGIRAGRKTIATAVSAVQRTGSQGY